MSREVVRVPAHWEHPMMTDHNGRVSAQPMYRRSFQEAEAEWLETFDRVRAGEEAEEYPGGVTQFVRETTTPDPDMYVPWSPEEATWYQLWETVSEGSPVSPPFATEDELIAYLAKNGDEWEQRWCRSPDWNGDYGVSGWGHERATRFVKGTGWHPTVMIRNGVIIQSGEDTYA